MPARERRWWRCPGRGGGRSCVTGHPGGPFPRRAGEGRAFAVSGAGAVRSGLVGSSARGRPAGPSGPRRQCCGGRGGVQGGEDRPRRRPAGRGTPPGLPSSAASADRRGGVSLSLTTVSAAPACERGAGRCPPVGSGRDRAPGGDLVAGVSAGPSSAADVAACGRPWQPPWRRPWARGGRPMPRSSARGIVAQAATWWPGCRRVRPARPTWRRAAVAGGRLGVAGGRRGVRSMPRSSARGIVAQAATWWSAWPRVRGRGIAAAGPRRRRRAGQDLTYGHGLRDT